MSYSVSGTMITLTRGDTFSALITITDLNDNQYIPMNGDRIRFAMKDDLDPQSGRYKTSSLRKVRLRH